MNDNSSVVAGVYAAVIALVALGLIISRCTIDQNKIDLQVKITCIENGGEWLDTMNIPDRSPRYGCVKQ